MEKPTRCFQTTVMGIIIINEHDMVEIANRIESGKILTLFTT